MFAVLEMEPRAISCVCLVRAGEAWENIKVCCPPVGQSSSLLLLPHRERDEDCTSHAHFCSSRGGCDCGCPDLQGSVDKGSADSQPPSVWHTLTESLLGTPRWPLDLLSFEPSSGLQGQACGILEVLAPTRAVYIFGQVSREVSALGRTFP